MGGIAVITVGGAIGLTSFATQEAVSNNIKDREPVRAVTNLISGAIIGAFLVSVAVAFTALVAVLTPVLIGGSVSLSAKNARENPQQGFLSRIFGGYKAVSESSNQIKANIQKQLDRVKPQAREVD